ncbi:MAG: NAD+ synthase [Flavobacteriales bacterium]|nr:NAD+ synthase [Flavobacteriales bacterium]
MKIALAQINPVIGDFERNVSLISNNIHQAKAMGAELVVFPELSICGYPPQDFLEFSDFLHRCNQSVQHIADLCRGIAAIVGVPTLNPNIEGKNLYNSALLLHEGKIIGEAHKALLPTYDIFDEYRYFEPARHFNCVEYQGVRIALTVCEDIWDIEEDLLYTVSPLDELARQKPEIAINISASPFSYAQASARKKVVTHWAKKLGIPHVYVNHAGAQTELIFDGGSLVSDIEGKLVAELTYFREDLQLVDTQNLHSENFAEKADNKTEKIYEALVCGVRDYFSKLRFQKAVLGLSGGIDSALTAVLACDALGAENVHGLLMPSQYSSDHSVADAEQLARNLGMSYDIVPIKTVYGAFEHQLSPLFAGKQPDLTEENIQARIRGTLLMAYSNKFSHILLNTSNKSENAVGYGTLYGDMCGGLGVLGDVYKTEVYALSEFINRNGERIPKNSITKPPSAELRPDQKDSDSLPEYDALDAILYQYIEERKGPQEITDMGFDGSLVLRVLRMVNRAEFKRKQAAPILRVSPKAFGHGRRLPIVGKYLE